jgi:hypothetical protein
MQGTDELLFSLGKPRVVDAPYRDASVGKVLPEALYVQERNSSLCHRSSGFSMAARASTSGVSMVPTSLSLAVSNSKSSYLSYPKFDADPHPARPSKFPVFRLLVFDIFSSLFVPF